MNRLLALAAALLSCMFASPARAESCATGTPEERIGCLAVQVDMLNAYVNQLQAVLVVNGNGDAVFTGTNVYVQNGSGETNSVNGKGNLIVGYGESDGTEVRTGSHNLVVGKYNGWGSFGALIAGFHNSSSARYASVVGGRHNRAGAFAATVAGGQHNAARAPYSTVVGGQDTSDGGNWTTTVGNEMGAVPGLSDFLTVDVPNQAIYFDGANVYVRSGSGSTAGFVNGTGNLIVGYDEELGSEDRGGSHNLVVGSYNAYASYGGVVFGSSNSISGPFAAVIGGGSNSAEGFEAVVIGGGANIADGPSAVVTGGYGNASSGLDSTVVGGTYATSTDTYGTSAGNADVADLATTSDLTGLATTAYVDSAAPQGLSDYLKIDTVNDAVVFRGANVYVQSGKGATDSAVNGLGNLIVGYGENSNFKLRTGSHNLVVGAEHGWESYGGVVFGLSNAVSAPYASVTGGLFNSAVEEMSVVTGGLDNTASGPECVVTGGSANTASGSLSVVTGGDANTASGTMSVVVGGFTGEAAGFETVVVGGLQNVATEQDSVVVGGTGNETTGLGAVVTGGQGNTASGNYSVVP